MSFNIAIIGAGPAGLLLARLLTQASVPVTVFEGEAALDFRSQGGTLDLHEETGLAALKRAGLFDEFLKYARYDGEAFTFADKRLVSFVKLGGRTKKGSKGGRPEIDRPRLRELLVQSLPEGVVRWGARLQRVEGEGDLVFEDGVERGFDLVVGADGAWSKVRPLLSDAVPFYSGIAGQIFTIPEAEATTPELYKLVNRGNLMAYSDHKSIMGQFLGDGRLWCSTWSRRNEDWMETCGYNPNDLEAVKEGVREEYAGWDARLLDLTQKAVSTTPRSLYMLPIGHSWKYRKGATLIGDAAHLATPFAGEGVNLAMEDAMKLGAAIISAAPLATSLTPTPPESREDSLHKLDAGVAKFEQDMFVRATKTTQLTYDMMSLMFFEPGAPRATIERYFLTAVGNELGFWGMLLLKPVVYAWFFVFKLIW